MTKEDFFSIINEEQYGFSFHNDGRVESNLITLMIKIGAPNHAYKQILQWAKNADMIDYKFNPNQISFCGQIKSMEKTNNMNHLRPTTKRVSLPPNNLT